MNLSIPASKQNGEMKERKERNSGIRDLHKKGYTYKEVGLQFGVSRQRAHQIDHKVIGCATKKPSIWRFLWGIFKELIR